MGFKSILNTEFNSDELKEEYRNGERIGISCVGANHFFFTKGLNKYYIDYVSINRAYRRVMLIEKGKKTLRVENVIIESGEKEVAVVGMKTTEDAKRLLDALKSKNDLIITVCPEREDK